MGCGRGPVETLPDHGNSKELTLHDWRVTLIVYMYLNIADFALMSKLFGLDSSQHSMRLLTKFLL